MTREATQRQGMGIDGRDEDGARNFFIWRVVLVPEPRIYKKGLTFR